MKSNLIFYEYNTGNISDCGDVLKIDISSQKLTWEGIILEKGSSPYFYPTNIATPYFYFALSLEDRFSWQITKNGNDEQITTNPGEIWINPPESPFTHNISEKCYFIILAIEKSEFFSALDFDMKKMEKELLFIGNYNVNDLTLKNIIELFYLETINDGRNGKAYIQNLLKILVTHYINNYSNYLHLISSKNLDTVIDDKSIVKIEKYIEENLENNIAIDDMAAYLNMSKFYFLKEYKRKTGITPYQHIIDRRLEIAKKYLEETDDSISEISYRCGFADQSHFSKAFKKKYEITPKDFRKNK